MERSVYLPGNSPSAGQPVAPQGGDLARLHIRLDSLEAALSIRLAAICTISSAIYGSQPTPALPPSESDSFPFNQLNRKIDECFHVLDIMDIYIEELRRL